MSDYKKIRGHHCWWLSVDAKSVANFDICGNTTDEMAEKYVDDIVSMADENKSLQYQLEEAKRINEELEEERAIDKDIVKALEAHINKFLFFAGSEARSFYLKNGDFDYKSPMADIMATAIDRALIDFTANCEAQDAVVRHFEEVASGLRSKASQGEGV